MSDPSRATDAEAELEGFFARYEPPIARLGKALRAKLRQRLPGLNELVYVYESQHSLVIAYSPTEGGGGSDALCGLALYPDCAKLFFTQGVTLSKSDPDGLLEGSGKTVRHVVLQAAADLDRPGIEGLLAAALKLAKVRLDARAKGALILKVEAQRQRARRAKQAARAASAPRTRKPRR